MRRLVAVLALVVLSSGCSVEELIHLAFNQHSPEVQAEAVEVAECESGLDPAATNGEYRGLFQLGQFHYHRIHEGDWSNPLHNAIAAESLYSEQGWGPWAGCR